MGCRGLAGVHRGTLARARFRAEAGFHVRGVRQPATLDVTFDDRARVLVME